MPTTRLGQLITFQVETDDDQRFESSIWIAVQKKDTVQKIASRRGHPELARRIADMNNIRSVRSVLTRKQIKVPGTLRKASGFHVLAGDGAPQVTGGYSKLEILDRPQRVGLTNFMGYDPITMDIPIRFEAFATGQGVNIEVDIRTLERMAGRGNFAGVGVGPPPVIRVSTTNGRGEPVPLIPANYQWSKDNPSAPLWRVSGIAWDAEPIRNGAGNRIRQLAVVTVQQHVKVSLATRSASERARSTRPRR